jgi:hypothetical protein
MQKIRIIGFFFENNLHWQVEVEKFFSNGSFRLYICLGTHKILMHNSLNGFEKWWKNLRHTKM